MISADRKDHPSLFLKIYENKNWGKKSAMQQMQCVFVYTIIYMHLPESIIHIIHRPNCIYMGKLRILIQKYLNMYYYSYA